NIRSPEGRLAMPALTGTESRQPPIASRRRRTLDCPLPQDFVRRPIKANRAKSGPARTKLGQKKKISLPSINFHTRNASPHQISHTKNLLIERANPLPNTRAAHI